MSAADLISVTLLFASGEGERVSLAGSTEQRAAVGPPLRVELRPAGLLRLFVALKRAIRLTVRVVYLFPLLLLLKFVCRAAGLAWGEAITVAFVGLVVVLFLLLALLVLLYPAVGPPSGRRSAPRLVALDRSALERLGLDGVAPTSLAELARLGADGQTGPSILRVGGTVNGGDARSAGEMLLHERWTAAGRAVAGLFTGQTVAVLGADRLPVIVELQAPALLLVPSMRQRPLALSAPLRQRVDGWLAPLAPQGIDLARFDTVPTYELRHGDSVELFARDWQPIFDLDGLQVQGHAGWFDAASGPYRGHRGPIAILVRSTAEHPVVFCCPPAAGNPTR